MASTSADSAWPSEKARHYLVQSDLCFSKDNSKIQRVETNDPTNKQGYTFLGFYPDDTWSARKCKAVYEHLDSEGYNWYALLHDHENSRPYLGRRVSEVDPYNTQRDKYNIPKPVPIEEPEPGITFPELEEAANRGKQPEYLTDYDSDKLKETKEHHSTDDELNKEMAFNASVIRNSPIGVRPVLSSSILTRMSATLIQTPATTQVATTTTTTGTTTNLTANQRITAAINR